MDLPSYADVWYLPFGLLTSKLRCWFLSDLQRQCQGQKCRTWWISGLSDHLQALSHFALKSFRNQAELPVTLFSLQILDQGFRFHQFFPPRSQHYLSRRVAAFQQSPLRHRPSFSSQIKALSLLNHQQVLDKFWDNWGKNKIMIASDFFTPVMLRNLKFHIWQFF